MGIFAERMKQLNVRSSSPDRRITAALSPPRQLDLNFMTGTFRQYREPVLEKQLGALATSLWAEYRRGVLAASAEATGDPAGQPREDLEPERKRFREACAQIVAASDGLGGQINVTTTGLVRWEVSIARGTLAGTDEASFCHELLAAAQMVLDSYLGQVHELRNAFFGDPWERTEPGPWQR